jgi:hypothetical protein
LSHCKPAPVFGRTPAVLQSDSDMAVFSHLNFHDLVGMHLSHDDSLISPKSAWLDQSATESIEQYNIWILHSHVRDSIGCLLSSSTYGHFHAKLVVIFHYGACVNGDFLIGRRAFHFSFLYSFCLISHFIRFRSMAFDPEPNKQIFFD